ncbi:MAG: hypothetical protein AAFN11_22110 [Chloroflexota bacterium]
MITITRPGKYALMVDTPVMNGAGTLGFANAYLNMIDVNKLGAYVTNPVTYEGWSPAHGTRVVPLDAGVLMHTGLPNAGVRKTIQEFSPVWRDLSVPTIMHLIATNTDHIQRAIEMIDYSDAIMGIELGLNDDITWQEAESLVRAATEYAEKPVLVRLPMYDAYEIAGAVADAGADALVISAPPRGTARDPRSGQLVSGRVYSPIVKAQALKIAEVIATRIKDVPIIGAGGIHSIQDARDFLEVGAVAVQVDSVVWIQPRIIERIARDLSGNLVTKAHDAYPDEWHPDMGDTEFRELFGGDDD